MANTKKLTKPERKKAKRKARKELKKLFSSLNRTQRSELRAEPQGIKEYLSKKKK